MLVEERNQSDPWTLCINFAFQDNSDTCVTQTWLQHVPNLEKPHASWSCDAEVMEQFLLFRLFFEKGKTISVAKTIK